MNQTDKIRVAVLYGGRSAEHEVSLRSAANVIQYLDSSRYEVIPVGIDKQGQWFLGTDVFKTSVIQNQVAKPDHLTHTWFTPEWVGVPVKMQDAYDILPTQSANRMFDVVFPAVHGTFCEDGTLQGLLELAELPYVGCGVLSSAVGMDKDISKRLAMLAGVYVAPYVVLKQDHWKSKQIDYIQEIESRLHYPVFVKPANTGSSIGISKAKNKEQLLIAIEDAFRFDTKILVEKALNVIELEVAVLESLIPGEDPIASIVGEIRPSHEFYSYEAKYVDEKGAELLIPASVSDEIQQQVRETATLLFSALECEGMARVDLFYDKDTQQICFNEINTLPGFTQISMYPKLMAATGISYTDLLTHLVQLAIKRHDNKCRLVRQYEGELVVGHSS